MNRSPPVGIARGQKGLTMNRAYLGYIPNEERLIDRMEQLREYLHDFPDGLTADAARSELANLEQLHEEWFV